MITIETKTVKDGNGTIVHTWEIDTSKPRMWIEDGCYKFNRELVSSVRTADPRS